MPGASSSTQLYIPHFMVPTLIPARNLTLSPVRSISFQAACRPCGRHLTFEQRCTCRRLPSNITRKAVHIRQMIDDSCFVSILTLSA